MWSVSEEEASGATAAPGDWLLIAADADASPQPWALSLARNPDRSARRMVAKAANAQVSPFLSLAPSLDIDEEAAIGEWLQPARGDSATSHCFAPAAVGGSRKRSTIACPPTLAVPTRGCGTSTRDDGLSSVRCAPE